MTMDTELRLSIARCEICYAGFRAAFHDTLDCLLRHHVDPVAAAGKRSGFLDSISILASTAPQVQLECLFRTWQHVVDPRTAFPTPLDHCVLYASLDALAAASISGDQRLLKRVWQGPRKLVTPADCWLPARVHCLQALHRWLVPVELDDSRPTQDVPSARAIAGKPAVRVHNLNGRRSLDRRNDKEELLNTVGRWTVDGAILVASEGLLNENELAVIRTFFQEHPRLLTRT